MISRRVGSLVAISALSESAVGGAGNAIGRCLKVAVGCVGGTYVPLLLTISPAWASNAVMKCFGGSFACPRWTVNFIQIGLPAS